MRFIIHHTPTGDTVDITGDTEEECERKAGIELKRRGWKERDCWSEPFREANNAD
jgi:hypothetical protein